MFVVTDELDRPPSLWETVQNDEDAVLTCNIGTNDPSPQHPWCLTMLGPLHH